MRLAGQESSAVHSSACPDRSGRAQSQRGYAMAALLIGLAVMAIMMGAMLPVWSHMVQREKEEELIFRGKQYARAIGLFQRKFANTPPPSIDVLVEQHFLRKKYKDPITNEDFQPIYANQAGMSVSSPTGARAPGQVATPQLATPPQPVTNAGGTFQNGATGGIIGVTSKSKETSIKLYNGRDKYNEWAFVYIQTAQRVQGPGQGNQPGQQGIPAGRGGPNGPNGPNGQQPFGPQGGFGGRGGPNGMPNGFGGAPNGQPNRPPLPGGQGPQPSGGSTIFQPRGPSGQPFQPGFGQPGTVQPGGTQPGVIRPPTPQRPPGL
jgi:type II secretory pathway pseudopilin PulG